MTSFKKFLAPLTAVALVAVMAVSLLGQQRTASATGEAAPVTLFTTRAPIQAAGLVETYTVGFRTAADGDILAGGTITTTWPAGFVIPAVPVCTVGANFVGAALTCATVGQVVTATLGVGTTVADATAVTFTIAGITNPATAQVFAVGAGPGIVTSGNTTAVASLVAMTIWTTTATKTPTSGTADGAGSVTVTFTSSAAAATG
ncbi:MAG: hypothetical protein DWI58_10595, partial [Chloroflexi bacterium]